MFVLVTSHVRSLGEIQEMCVCKDGCPAFLPFNFVEADMSNDQVYHILVIPKHMTCSCGR